MGYIPLPFVFADDEFRQHFLFPLGQFGVAMVVNYNAVFHLAVVHG